MTVHVCYRDLRRPVKKKQAPRRLLRRRADQLDWRTVRSRLLQAQELEPVHHHEQPEQDRQDRP